MVFSDITAATISSDFKNSLAEQIDAILDVLMFDSRSTECLAMDERAFPGELKYLENGYYKKMLQRYLFAGSRFCREKKILDTCCGLGWGTYLLSFFASEVHAFDLDENVIRFCRSVWQNNNIFWNKMDCLDLSSIKANEYNVILGFETIEHFNCEQAQRYVAGVSRLLNQDGLFIGTSAFPETTQEADMICEKNPYHLHVFTTGEMEALLKPYFSEYKILDNWFFFARK